MDGQLKWSDAKKLLAWKLHKQGYSAEEIATIVDAGVSSVFRWIQRAKQHGPDSLIRTYKKRAQKLSTEQLEQLTAIVDAGAIEYGYESDHWSASILRQVIIEQFGVEYDLTSVRRILRQLGYSWQKPQKTDHRRDEQAVHTWKHETWPELKKKQKTTKQQLSS